jgi:hypothetical protein
LSPTKTEKDQCVLVQRKYKMNEKTNKKATIALACIIVANTTIFLHKETPHIHHETYYYHPVNPTHTIAMSSSSSTENLYANDATWGIVNNWKE